MLFNGDTPPNSKAGDAPAWSPAVGLEILFVSYAGMSANAIHGLLKSVCELPDSKDAAVTIGQK
jgi:hypothetical protein